MNRYALYLACPMALDKIYSRVKGIYNDDDDDDNNNDNIVYDRQRDGKKPVSDSCI